MKDYNVLFFTMKHTEPEKLVRVEYAVEFKITETIHEMFARIAKKLGRKIEPSDYIVIRHCDIDLEVPKTTPKKV